MVKKYCSQCGTQLKENSKFCPGCGKSLDDSSDVIQKSQYAEYTGGNMHQPGQQFQSQNIQQPYRQFSAGQQYQNNFPPGRKKSKVGKVVLSMIAILVLVIVVIAVIPSSGTEEEQMAAVDLKTYIAGQMYIEAELQTAKVLNSGPDEVSYESWKSGLEDAILYWEEVEKRSTELVKLAEKLESEGEGQELAALFITQCYAEEERQWYQYSKEEITKIYDNAPKGPKGARLKTLAKHLGVTAAKARQILTMSNEQIKADVWNNRADTYQKLENTARVIKDVSKVTVYTGGYILSGGATSVIGAVNLAVSGADLVFEIGEDAAIIAYGEDSKTAKSFKSIRSVTSPAANILALNGLLSGSSAAEIAQKIRQLRGLTGMDKIKAIQEIEKWGKAEGILFAADQIRGAIQDGQVLGFEVNWLKGDDGKKNPAAGMAVMTTDQAIQKGIISQDTVEPPKLVLDEKPQQDTKLADSKTQNQYNEEKADTKTTEQKQQDNPDNTLNQSAGGKINKAILGTWKLIGTADKDLNYGSDVWEGVKESYTFTEDGEVIVRTNNYVDPSDNYKSKKGNFEFHGTFEFDGNKGSMEYDYGGLKNVQKLVLKDNKLYLLIESKGQIVGGGVCKREQG